MDRRRAAWRPLLVGAAIGALGALLFLIGALGTLGSFATDRFFLSRPADPSIVIVAIDDASLSSIGRWPWSRGTHAEVIRKLHALGATAIGYDVNFPESSTPEADRDLANALYDAGTVVLPVELKLISSAQGMTADPKGTVLPIPSIANAARGLGHTNTPPDADGIVRRIPITVASTDGNETPSFALRLLEIVHPERDIRQIPTDPALNVRVNFDGPPHTIFRTVSAADLLADRVPATDIRGKVVFIGATAPDLHDLENVPTSIGSPMPGVEIHASLYDTILTKRWLMPIPWGLQAGMILAFGVIVASLTLFLRARYSLPLTIVLWVALLVVAFGLFDLGIIVDIVWSSLTIVFAYAAVTLERRVTADHDRIRLRGAFSRYVSSSVVEAILRDPKKLKLGGEKRNMTVLFSDVRGFTTISENLSAERLVHVMNTYLSRMTDVVFATDGVLDKYIGDAVMAFWNAPFSQRDHAIRAVKTAILMQEALAEMNQQKDFGPDLTLTVGIGINTGDMIVGNMGSEARFDYTVIGDNVNLGSRVEGMTKEYGVGILITEATRIAAGKSIIARRVDKVAVKGRSEPTVVYEVIGLASSVTEEDVRLAKDFEEAFDRYMNGDFENAIAICGSILQDHPGDGPCRTIIARSHQFLQDPPPEDWNGTWVMKTK